MAVCKICKIEKGSDQFYGYYHSTQQKWRVRRMCKNCYQINKKKNKVPNLEPESITIQTIQQEEIIQPESLELICGTFEEYNARTKNQYGDENKQVVYDFMVSIGFIYDTNTFIWYKPGWYKDNKGNWNLPKTNYLYKNPERKSKVNLEQIKGMKELRRRGWSYARIALKYDLDDNTVVRWVKKEI